MTFYRHLRFQYLDLTAGLDVGFRRAAATTKTGLLRFFIILSVVLTQAAPAFAQAFVTVEPDVPDVGNCAPFGIRPSGNPGITGPWGPFGGFIYQNVPAFNLQVGGTLAFDLGAPNDVDIGLDIHMAPTTVNGGTSETGNFTKIVSNTAAPSNPRGDSITGNYELEFMAENPFIFPGGGLIIRFSNPSATYKTDITCTQVLVHGDPSDTSGFFVERFFPDANGFSPWDVEFPDTIGAFRVSTVAQPMPNLIVSLFDNPDPVDASAILTYTVSILNPVGADDATGVIVTVTLPATAAYQSASILGCNEAGGIVTCNLGTIASGTGVNFDVVVTAPPTAGTITARADATSNEPDSDNSDNFSIQNTVVSVADISFDDSIAPNNDLKER